MKYVIPFLTFLFVSIPTSVLALTRDEMDRIQNTLDTVVAAGGKILPKEPWHVDFPWWFLVVAVLATIFVIIVAIKVRKITKASVPVPAAAASPTVPSPPRYIIRPGKPIKRAKPFDIPALTGRLFLFFPPEQVDSTTGLTTGYQSLFSGRIYAKPKDAIKSSKRLLKKMSAPEIDALVADGTLYEVTPAPVGAVPATP